MWDDWVPQCSVLVSYEHLSTIPWMQTLNLYAPMQNESHRTRTLSVVLSHCDNKQYCKLGQGWMARKTFVFGIFWFRQACSSERVLGKKNLLWVSARQASDTPKSLFHFSGWKSKTWPKNRLIQTPLYSSTFCNCTNPVCDILATMNRNAVTLSHLS